MILLNERKISLRKKSKLESSKEGQDFLSEAKLKFEKTKNET
jgi:hypothetical protein